MRLIALAAIVLVLAGCVWTRLLDLKGQFKDFDRYIEPVNDGEALLLRFKEPCIQPDDIGFLLGGDPTVRTAPDANGVEVWTYRLKRDRADSIGLEITLQAKAGMTTSMRVPPEVLRFVPRERVLAMARALGNADIDRDKREAASRLTGEDAKPISPGRATIVAALGEPDATEAQEGGASRLVYRFHLQKPDQTLGAVSSLLLDLKEERLVALRLEAPRFNTWLKLDGDGK